MNGSLRPPRLPRVAPCIALLLAACAGEKGAERGAAVERPPVVLISIDTLRSDRLPAYGYDGVETPAIDGLRADGILYERAYSPFPLTLPSHATMLTGLLPPDHGVRDNNGYKLEASSLPFLPRILQRQGYRTGAAVSSWVLRRSTGLAEAFDFYEDAFERSFDTADGSQRTGPETLAAIRPWLREASSGPFFLFFHIYEPHGPFAPPEPYASRYASPYDGEVAAADAVIGDLLAELESLGVYERALVVLTSDHGEGLREHVEEKHGVFLYREALQVPLLVKLPDNEKAGETARDPAHLVDILPTVLAVVGSEAPEGVAGLSLLAPTGAERALYAETYYPRLYFGWSELRSIVQGRYQYIDSPEPELFDLVADPGERNNLVAQERPVVTRLRQELREIPAAFEEPRDTDEAARRQLASLGYIGMLRSDSSGSLPSPRSQAHLLPQLESAMVAAEGGRHDEAVDGFRAVLAANPRMQMVWPMLARSLEKSGSLPEALEAYRQALEAAESSPRLALAAARVAYRLGRSQEAERYSELAAPAFPVAYRMVAQLALRRGDLARAREAALAAVEADPADSSAHLLLAQVELELGDFEAALAGVGRAQEAAGGSLQGVELLRGNIFARSDRGREAIDAYEREIAGFPADPRAYVQQVYLRARRGEIDEVVPLLRRLTEGNGTALGWVAAVRTLRALGDESTAATLAAEARRRFPDSVELRELG